MALIGCSAALGEELRGWSPSWLLGLVVLLAFGSSATPVSAQFLAHYKAGVEAVSAEDWEAVADLMSKAIEERPEERNRLPARFYMRAYIPHFYLGVARHRLGDCEGALEAWANSEGQGVLPGLESAMRLVAVGRDACQREHELAVALADAKKELAAASVGAAALLNLARRDFTRDVWEVGDPAPAVRHREGLGLLAESRKHLATPQPTLADVREAQTSIRRANQLFETLRVDVLDLTQQREQAIGTSQKGVGELGDRARSILAQTEYLAPYPTRIGRARTELEALVGEVERRSSEIESDYLAGLNFRLRNSLSDLESAAEPPSKVLSSAAEAFIVGRYDEAVETLDAARLPDRRSRAHASLLLAAARYALFLDGGQVDSRLLEAAAEEVRACRGADRSVTPSSRIFSPRFVEFFAESAASGSG